MKNLPIDEISKISDTKTLKSICKKISKKEEEVTKLYSELREELKNTPITCNGYFIDGCGETFRIGDIEYIQGYYEDSDYDRSYIADEHEGGFKCPKCGARNRLFDLNNTSYYIQLKYYFKSIKKQYDRYWR